MVGLSTMLIAGLFVEASPECTFFIPSELHNFQRYKSYLDRLMGHRNSHYFLCMFFSVFVGEAGISRLGIFII